MTAEWQHVALMLSIGPGRYRILREISGDLPIWTAPCGRLSSLASWVPRQASVGIGVKAASHIQLEPRWPVALAILVTLVIVAELPERVALLPWWTSYLAGLVVLAPVVAVSLTAPKRTWLRAERITMFLFFIVATSMTLANLANLLIVMIRRSSEIGGLQLLSSSVGVWMINVLMFALLYWQIDREGPEARLNYASTRPDWFFPQESAPGNDVPTDWHPTFIDYLFLAYSTATAFSTTDTVPLTARAKMLMMLESSFSLMTIAVVASRAINILGS